MASAMAVGEEGLGVDMGGKGSMAPGSNGETNEEGGLGSLRSSKEFYAAPV